MNFIVLPLCLFDALKGSPNPVSENIISTIRDVYGIGKFDGLLLIEGESSNSSEKFSFAKVHRMSGKDGLGFADAASEIVDIIDKFHGEIGTPCMFTVVCRDRPSMRHMAEAIRPKQCICLMQLNDSTDRRTFTNIPIVEHDDAAQYNYFMEKIAEYTVSQ
jgi:hypothetical protein